MATELQGFVYDNAGNAISGATVQGYVSADNPTTTAGDSTTTDSNGKWTISTSTASHVPMDIKITYGSNVRWLKGYDKINLTDVTVSGSLIVGEDDTGHDVKLYGATSGSFLFWDESDDTLKLTDSTPLKIGDGADMTLYHNGSDSYITNETGALKIATENSGIAVTIGHTTSEVTIADNLTVTGTLTLGSGAELSEAELEMLDGITAGTAAASKALVLDANKDIGTIRNLTIDGTFSDGNYTFDTSGNVSGLGTVASGAITTSGVLDITDTTDSSDATGDTGALRTEGGASIAKKLYVGTDVSVGNDLTVTGDTTLNGSVTLGNAATDVITINGTVAGANAVIFEGDAGDGNEVTLSFVDPDADRTIYMPNQGGYLGVFAADTSSTQISATPAELNILDGVTSTTAELNILDGATVVVGEINALDLGSTAVGNAIASKAVVLDSNLDYTGIRNFTITGELDAATLDISGDADVDGTLEADAYTVDGTALNEYIADTVGAMFTSNTETRISATYQDSDNTIDLVVDDMSSDNDTTYSAGDGLDLSGTTFSTDLKTNGGLEIQSTELSVAQGISQYDVAQFAAGVADDDFLRIDGTSVEGRSASEVLSDIGAQASLTFGISNTNAVKIDAADVADDEYARFTANGLESRTAAEVAADIEGSIDAVGTLASGAISSGFGNIDIGSSTFDTTGAVTTGNLSPAGDVAIADGKVIKLGGSRPADDEPNTANNTGYGIVVLFDAGAAVDIGDAVSIGTDGRVIKTVADATGTLSGPCIGVATTAAASADDDVYVMTHGVFRHDDWNFGTKGQAVYIEEADPGDLSLTAPNDDGDYVQRVGVSITDDVLLVMPSIDVIEHA